MAFAKEELRASKGGFAQSRQVRFQDVDAAGIVFFARLFEYFHDALVAWMDGAGMVLHRALKAGAWGAPLKHAEADFLRPLRFGDEISIAVASAWRRGSAPMVGFQFERGGNFCVGA